MGRPRSKEVSSVYSFSVNPSDKHSVILKRSKRTMEFNSIEAVDLINEIADVERVSRSKIIERAIVEYVANHYEGNYQTLLDDSLNDGYKTKAGVEAGVRQMFLDKADSRGVQYRDILAECRSRGVPLKEVVAVAEGVAVWLHGKGVKVWR